LQGLCLEWRRKHVPGWPKTTGGRIRSSPAIGDIDGDGDLEIVVGSDDGYIHAWHHDGSLVSGWPRYIKFGGESSPGLGNIDRDGRLEIVIGSFWKKVWALNSDGTILWSVDIGTIAMSSPILGDIDRDGRLEVTIGADDGRVWAWDAEDGSEVLGFPIFTGGRIHSTPAIGE
jgi:hypothetical protein